MHELALFAQISDDRVDYVKSAVSAISGMPPVPLLEHHLLYKPKRTRQSGPIGPAGVGGNTITTGGSASAADLYYLELVADIKESQKTEKTDVATSCLEVDSKANKTDKESRNDNSSDKMDLDPQPPLIGQSIIDRTSNLSDLTEEARRLLMLKDTDEYEYSVKDQKWVMKFSDLPEVSGKRPVTSRIVYHATIVDGDALSFMDNLGYTLVSECITSGHYFVYHNTCLTLTRILIPPQPFVPLPTSSLHPLDPVNSYVLQATLRVASSNELDTLNKGIEELKVLKMELRGIVDLEIGDRLSLDTRVR